MRFTVIGITDNPAPTLTCEAIAVVRQAVVFAGGRRHHEIVAPLLPEGVLWIDITVPLDAVFDKFVCHDHIVVFASGDPLFFGFANTIRRKLPDAAIRLLPAFNSLQTLAHRLVLPYHDMRMVSLTGRPWVQFDNALIHGESVIGVLTDRVHTPATIARRMIDYGYTGYTMHVGEHLGNPDAERVRTLTLDEAANTAFAHPNCLILQATRPHDRFFGIPDSKFALLDGREKMITKMPIRLLTLQALQLQSRHVLWDIGFCTGSVSIEARLLFAHLRIDAFEVRPECEAIMDVNAKRIGAPGIAVHMGDFLSADITALPHPDAVFIGGHGGHLQEIMQKVLTVLEPDGIIVMNSVKAPLVKTDSHKLFDEACTALRLVQDTPTRILLDNHHPIEILKCRRQP